MTRTEDQKQHIELAIERARDGVSVRIDELDRALREKLDVKSAASEHAPQIIAGGAALGFLVGFGMPKLLGKLLAVGVPLALVAMKVKQSRDAQNELGSYSEI